MLAILGLIYLLRGPLLIGIAETWVVREPVEKADAIVLLGGGLQTRPFEAARLYHEGYAPRVITMDVELAPTDRLGVTVSHTELMKQVLLKEAVPEQAIVIIGDKVSSTYEEAVALRNWVRESGARNLIAPTDLFHTRRVSWFFRKILKDTGVHVRVEAIDPLEYTAANWWHHEEGLVDFQNEIIKFFYYLLKY